MNKQAPKRFGLSSSGPAGVYGNECHTICIRQDGKVLVFLAADVDWLTSALSKAKRALERRAAFLRQKAGAGS